MQSTAHDLLLLMTNLSQVEDNARVRSLFTEAISSLSPGFSVEFTPELPTSGAWMDIVTVNRNYGFLRLTGRPEDVSPTFPALFANSVQILATILENHLNRARIQDERDLLQEEVEAATASLRASDARHRAMISNISDVIGIISPDGSIAYKSPNIERWFGWKPEDLVGTNAWDTVHPDDMEWIQAEFAELIESPGATRTVTYRYKCKDRSYRWIELTASNRSGDPRIGGVLLNYHDVTERRAAEEALREREEQFRLAIEGSRDGLWDWDLEKDEAFISPMYGVILGYEPGELSLQPGDWQGLIHPDDASGVQAKVEKYFSGEGDYFQDVYRMRTKGGDYRWIVGRGKALFDDDGTPTRFLGFITDITQSKQVEQRLLAEEKRWILAQNMARFGNWEMDVSTAAITASDNAFEIFGIPLDPESNPDRQVSLERVEACMPDRERLHQALVELVEEGRPYEEEYEIVREADGRRAYVYSVAEVIRDEDGNVEKVHGTVQDVTDRKRGEMEIRHSRDRLRELTAQIDQVREEERLALARELHDEVGQNLTAMRMDLTSLEAELPEGWESAANRIRSLIDISQDSVDRLNRLSSELRSPVLDLLGLEDAVDTVVWEHRERWGMDVALSLDLEAYTGDSDRDLTAFRVIKEALTNVAKHARASHTEVKLHANDDTLRLEVLDDGVGIPEDGTAGSRSFGIVGMQERVARLGGTLSVSPRPEGGTRIQAEIPLDR